MRSPPPDSQFDTACTSLPSSASSTFVTKFDSSAWSSEPTSIAGICISPNLKSSGSTFAGSITSTFKSSFAAAVLASSMTIEAKRRNSNLSNTMDLSEVVAADVVVLRGGDHAHRFGADDPEERRRGREHLSLHLHNSQRSVRPCRICGKFRRGFN
eukprot:167330-Rhodomonas_salina.1